MNIETLSVTNFKIFDREVMVQFKDQTLDEVRSRFLVLGDNASGKTSLLQAIALPLALATGQIRSIDKFDWVGFVHGRYAKWGDPTIQLVANFTDDEIEATQLVAGIWGKSFGDSGWVRPGTARQVRLTLKGGVCEAESPALKFQFRGRYYASALLRAGLLEDRAIFERLPGVFWFDQYRSLESTQRPGDWEDDDQEGRANFEVGVARLREHLIGWQLLQQSRNLQYDFLSELEQHYKKFFPTHSFAGIEPRPDSRNRGRDDFYFLLDDGKRTYDIAEMSAGEQAVFPILYEFVRKRIAHSVVLIDEIDLFLHPPLAQEFLVSLPKLGPTCQFIFSTHARHVSSLMDQNQIFRLPGGKLCL